MKQNKALKGNLGMFILNLPENISTYEECMENYYNYLNKCAIKYFIFARTSIHIISSLFF